MRFSLIPFLLLAVPLLEIVAFIVIGGEIGVLATLAMIFVTAVLGSILLRIQGFGLLERIRLESSAGRVPGRELVHGIMILVAGVLLLTPGFITDALGFILFIPAVRDAGWSLLEGRIVDLSSMQASRQDKPGGKPSNTTIELGSDDYRADPNPDSPWSDQNRH